MKGFEYTPKKETDFILTNCTELFTQDNLFTYGFDVVFTNVKDDLKTTKKFRVKRVEYIKTVMSSEEIDEIPKER